jgi:arylsulfatase A-like enzyme
MRNCFCTNSICTPSRAAILTGQYSNRNGVYTLQDSLDPARNHVAKELKSAGYQTALIGKWHLATDPTGFDYWNILPGQGVYHNPTFINRGERKQYTGYCTDLIGDFTLDFLKQRDPKRPFFAMCHHKAPHRPWQPAAKYQDLFAGQTIPEPANLYDHYEGRATSVSAIQMRVGESMIRTDVKQDIPSDLKGDAAIRPGSVNREIVLNVDFAPMFLDYAGVKPSADMQGRTFRRNLEGSTPGDWRKAMYYRYWMHNDNDHHVPAHYGIRTDRWKLIYYYGKVLGMKGAQPPDTAPEWELFDLMYDPREMKNLYNDPKHASRVRELKSQLARLQAEAGDQPA